MRPAHDNNYFHFTKKERTGILTLTCIALISVATSMLYPYLFKSKASAANSYKDEIAKLEAQAVDSSSNPSRYKKDYISYKSVSKSYPSYTQGELFYFDPNTISESEWKRLGLREKTIATIKNYLSKGGMFKEPADIRKIWGLQEELADRIMPYARIAERQKTIEKRYPEYESNTKYPAKTYEEVNINEGDTAVLTKLPGIGPKLSQRIIKYRDRLGGFYKVEQIAETFGLPDSTFQKIRTWIKIEKQKIKTININTATLEELKTHPYIRYHLANALVQYREQHKSYASVNEIRNIMLVDDTTYRKVAPYLTVD